MAPGLVYVYENFDGDLAKSPASSLISQPRSKANGITKRSVYLLEVFPEEAVKYCQSHFQTILPTDPEVHNWRENADAIMVRETLITAEDISKCRKLKAIGKQGTGIDIIDVASCRAANIEILNTPGVNASTVAELTLTLALGVAREIRTISVRQAQGHEVRKEHCSGLLFQGTSLGVIGMGAIGLEVAKMFKGAFGCAIYAYDPLLSADAWQDVPHTRVKSIEEMLPQVDVLSLHVPLLPQTRGMISLAQLRMMKRTAILLNLARGGLVVEDDLILALQEGLIWGAGLDCHETEPPTLQNYQKLWAAGNVISTPHIGATCGATQVKTATTALEYIQQYFEKIDK